MEVTGQLNTARDIVGSLDINTPFNGLRTMGASFTLTPDLANLDLDAQAFLEGQKATVKATLVNNVEVSRTMNFWSLNYWYLLITLLISSFHVTL